MPPPPKLYTNYAMILPPAGDSHAPSGLYEFKYLGFVCKQVVYPSVTLLLHLM